MSRPTMRRSHFPRISGDHRRPKEVAVRHYLEDFEARSGVNLRDRVIRDHVRELAECTLELLDLAEMIRDARERRTPRAKLLTLIRNRRKSRVQRTMLEKHLLELTPAQRVPTSIQDLLLARRAQ